MGRNVFVSYKYHDDSVRQFQGLPYGETTARNYADIVSKILKETESYYFMGERDGEDLSGHHYKAIEKALADKMFHTSITIVLISPKMFENIQEIEQWIPWEISYSLKSKTRSEGKSYMNAILAVVLPDRRGRYNYAMYSDGEDIFVKEKAFFEIILANMFNRKGADLYEDPYGNPMYVPGDSYVALAKWGEFNRDPEYYLGIALDNRRDWKQFDIVKRIDEDWES